MKGEDIKEDCREKEIVWLCATVVAEIHLPPTLFFIVYLMDPALRGQGW